MTWYLGVSYSHQGWFTEDQDYFLLGDELDEQYFGHNTPTRVFNVSYLDEPDYVGSYVSVTSAAIDHNQYVKELCVDPSNYGSGLRILIISNVATAGLTKVAFFDIHPARRCLEQLSVL